MKSQLNRFWRPFAKSMQREWGIMLHDSNIRLVLAAAPLAYLLLFGSVYQNKKVYDVPIMVVDMDRSELSRAVTRSLDANEALRVAFIGNDEAEIQRRLLDESIWGAVLIPRDFARDIKHGSHAGVILYANAASIVVFDHAQTGMQSVLGAAAAGVAMEKIVLRNGTGLMAYESYMPVEPITRILFNPSLNYSNFILPILFMILLHQVIALASGMSWALTYEQGARRGQPSGLEMAGKVFAYTIPALFWLLVEVIIVHRWMEIPVHGNIVLLMIFGVCVGVVAALFGAVIGSFVKSKVGIVQMLFFYSMPAVLISGAVWPLDAMPAPLHGLALVLPSTHVISTYQMLIHGIAPIGEWISAFGILVGFILLLGSLLYAQTKKG